MFYAGHDDSGLAVRVTVPCLRAEGIDDSAAFKTTAGQHAAWVTRPPEAQISQRDWLRAQDTATVTALLAYCTACTVKPERSLRTDQPVAALGSRGLRAANRHRPELLAVRQRVNSLAADLPRRQSVKRASHAAR